jgi:hypothetical protein
MQLPLLEASGRSYHGQVRCISPLNASMLTQVVEFYEMTLKTGSMPLPLIDAITARILKPLCVSHFYQSLQ